MKKIFLLLAILTISFFAFLDVKKLISELKNVSYARTPSQIEIRPLINQERGASSDVKYDSNKNNASEHIQNNNTEYNLQNSIERMNENRNKQLNSDYNKSNQNF